MTLKIDKHVLNSNPHSYSTWMVSQESIQVQDIQIAISQLIKMLFIVSVERRICTHISLSGKL